MNNNLIVVLSRPEIHENIGSVARCMLAFGLDELRLVGIDPLEEGSRAHATARTGDVLLRKARYFDTLREAVADCRQAFGFTRRVRDKSQTLLDLRDVGDRFENVKTALVFGCESKGLSQDEVLEMTHLIRMAQPDTAESSLNLSHAVAIALYALIKPDLPAEQNSLERATLAESQRVLGSALELLDQNGFLARGKKEAARIEKVRILWQRLQPTRRELDFISGALRALVERLEI
jgi:tRNA/rRNA methyltransferase